jgi:hypothetical protein
MIQQSAFVALRRRRPIPARPVRSRRYRDVRAGIVSLLIDAFLFTTGYIMSREDGTSAKASGEAVGKVIMPANTRYVIDGDQTGFISKAALQMAVRIAVEKDRAGPAYGGSIVMAPASTSPRERRFIWRIQPGPALQKLGSRDGPKTSGPSVRPSLASLHLRSRPIKENL